MDRPRTEGISATALPAWLLRLAFQGQMLDLSSTVDEAGIRDEDSVTAIVQPAKRIASTREAFALHCDGGEALA